jgi:hypothetical protein
MALLLLRGDSVRRQHVGAYESGAGEYIVVFHLDILLDGRNRSD